MDIESLKMFVRIATAIIYIAADVCWIYCSNDVGWGNWWAKTCAVVNILLLIVGVGSATVWAWI